MKAIDTSQQVNIPENELDSLESNPADALGPTGKTISSSPVTSASNTFSSIWGPLMHPQTPARAEALQHARANQVLTRSSWVLLEHYILIWVVRRL